MSIHDGSTFRERGRRGRSPGDRPGTGDRPDARTTGCGNHGILALVPREPQRDRCDAAPDVTTQDAELAQLRAERDAALEQIAFLEEQLRSTVAFHAHLLERERVRLLAEHEMLRELVVLGDELQRARQDASPAATPPVDEGTAVAVRSASPG